MAVNALNAAAVQTLLLEPGGASAGSMARSTLLGLRKMLSEKNEDDELRKLSWEKALYAFATGYIFEKRANKQRRKLRALTFLGILVPLSVGSIVISFGCNTRLVGSSIIVAGILGTVQIIGSGWALVAKWDDEYAYSLESAADNHNISVKYKELGENPPSPMEFKIRYGLINAIDEIRNANDYKHGITDKEKRMGQRAALKQFSRACGACHEVPRSMKPTKCDACGNF
jgi:mobilome CxxCx(11)CxxC protein